jgi:hypothetical protein
VFKSSTPAGKRRVSMPRKKHESYGQLPHPQPDFQITEDTERVNKLKVKLITLLSDMDFAPTQLSTVAFYQALILSKLLIYGKVNIRITLNEVWTELGMAAFSSENFEAATYIVYDWVSTGGKFAAEIGAPLE